MESTVFENFQCWKTQFSLHRLVAYSCRKLEVFVGHNFHWSCRLFDICQTDTKVIWGISVRMLVTIHFAGHQYGTLSLSEQGRPKQVKDCCVFIRLSRKYSIFYLDKKYYNLATIKVTLLTNGILHIL
jgi:hypothetical protein